MGNKMVKGDTKIKEERVKRMFREKKKDFF
jgi:hypothetical protein